MLFIAATLKLD